MLVATMCADDETVFLFLVLALGAGSWGVLGGVGVVLSMVSVSGYNEVEMLSVWLSGNLQRALCCRRRPASIGERQTRLHFFHSLADLNNHFPRRRFGTRFPIATRNETSYHAFFWAVE